MIQGVDIEREGCNGSGDDDRNLRQRSPSGCTEPDTVGVRIRHVEAGHHSHRNQNSSHEGVRVEP